MRNPVYWPSGDGYMFLILLTTQLGITRLTPAPRRPWRHNTNCLYASWRLALLSLSAFTANMSALYIFAIPRTPGSRTNMSTSCKQNNLKTLYMACYVFSQLMFFECLKILVKHGVNVFMFTTTCFQTHAQPQMHTCKHRQTLIYVVFIHWHI